MTDQEILEKTIYKVIDNGWLSTVPIVKEETQVVPVANNCVSIRWITPGGALAYSQTISIFSHDFAEALWGEHKEHEQGKCFVESRSKGWKPWDNGYKDWQDVPSELTVCRYCKSKYIDCISISGYRNCSKREVTQKYEPGFQYHLQQMVIADDPIKYLGNNI